MKRITRHLSLHRDTIRTLSGLELRAVAGGVPTALVTACAHAARAGTTSEAEGGGPCPGEYSWTCKP